MPRLVKFVAVGIGGGLLAFLFDPERGKGRRAKFRDQTMARMRDLRAATGRWTRFQSGRVTGLVHEMSADNPGEVDDAGLRQKIKSEVLGPARLSAIDVDVENGIVTLTGSLERAQSRQLAKQISKVPGVDSVEFRMAHAGGN